MLIDDITIKVKAGDGGDGLSHLRRNAMTAKGGPDGGDGGKGGDIYLTAIDDIEGLSLFRFKKHIKAEDAGKGKSEYNHGKNGEDFYLKLPLGTQVTDTETNQTWEISDIKTKILIAKGGFGGRGNSAFRSPTNQTPIHFTKGKKGQEKMLHLVLKIIADIGLIGLPNAGKSSLLKTLTNATPKIGNYAFTTLEPNLGVIPDQHLVIADIPGIIEGASKGKGLGIKFLRHIEKTKILLHCIDAQSNSPLKDYETIRHELSDFSNSLSFKKEIILLTKIDLVNKNKLKELMKIFKNKDILEVSIYDEKSISILLEILIKLNLNY